jgi:hypothetical protein
MSGRIEPIQVPQQFVPEEQSTSCKSPPANQLASYDTGYQLDNQTASPVAVGSPAEQAKQAAIMTEWTVVAAREAAGLPTEFEAKTLLKYVDPTPPDLKGQTEFANYSSTMKGVTPQDAFDYFVKNPTAWFGASGITLHPPVKELTDGARVALAEPGVTPPVFAPIEIHIDREARTINITTLDGHPLRGVNRFSFEANAQGDCELHQSSAFQLSSFAAEQGSAVMSKAAKAGVPGMKDAIQRQHEIWERAHANIADGAARR